MMQGDIQALDVMGQVIGGELGHILVRQKAGANLEIGDILVLEEKETGHNLVLSVFDLRYASQIDGKMHEMISGVTLEEGKDEEESADASFYEPDIVNYVIASIRPLARVRVDTDDNNDDSNNINNSNGKTLVTAPKALPPFHSTLRPVQKKDLAFLEKNNQDGLFAGSIRSGSKVIEDARVMLPIRDIFQHHVLIPATTGRGKSNLVKSMLWNVMDSGANVGILVLDAHDEYYGKTGVGLKNHKKSTDRLAYYTADRRSIPGARMFLINIRAVEPRHLEGIVELSDAQKRTVYGFYTEFGKDWIEAIMRWPSPVKGGRGGGDDDDDDPGHDDDYHNYIEDYDNDDDDDDSTGAKMRRAFGSRGKGDRSGNKRVTISVLRKKLEMLLDVYVDGKGQISSRGGVFVSGTKGIKTIEDVVHHIESGKITVLDTSQLNSSAELVVGNMVAAALLERYKYYKTQGTQAQMPVASIVIEEAPRVIGEDVLASGSDSIYATIAREGRKFQVGLVAVTQLASVIPKAILANMNTKIILGNEMKQEREALVASASQDLSNDDKNIASLDRGEAIITSVFVPFAIPIKVPLFEDLVRSSASAAPTSAVGHAFPGGRTERIRVFGQ